MAFYETTFIIRPDLTNQQADAVGEKLSKHITDNKGKLIRTENWGLRNLAYRLNKHRKGHYIHFGYEADGSVVDKLENQMRMNDDVIRFLTVKEDNVTKEPTPMMSQDKKPSRGRKSA